MLNCPPFTLRPPVKRLATLPRVRLEVAPLWVTLVTLVPMTPLSVVVPLPLPELVIVPTVLIPLVTVIPPLLLALKTILLVPAARVVTVNSAEPEEVRVVVPLLKGETVVMVNGALLLPCVMPVTLLPVVVMVVVPVPAPVLVMVPALLTG